MIVTITSGAHWRNVGIDASLNRGIDQFAHVFDPDEPEDVPHQAQNFVTYATSLGPSRAPHVLIAPERADIDALEWEHIAVEMADWRQIVTCQTGLEVVIA